MQPAGGSTATAAGGTISVRSFNGVVRGCGERVDDAECGRPGRSRCRGAERGAERRGELHGDELAGGNDPGGRVRGAADGAGGVQRQVNCSTLLCTPAGECNKRGRKFNADNDSGLAGWQICVFDSATWGRRWLARSPA